MLVTQRHLTLRQGTHIQPQVEKKKYLVPTRYYLSICDVFLRTPTVQVLTAWIRVLGRV
jgi:hypothetical protein